jgi:hypothetical protein
MLLGVEVPNVCAGFLDNFAYTVLNKCIPETMCDHNYEYMINDAFAEIQKCQSFDDSLYIEFYKRWQAIQDSCSAEGLLKCQLSGNLILENTGGPETSGKLDMNFQSESISMPLSFRTVNSSGYAEINEKHDIMNGIPLFPFSGSGTITYFPASEEERICSVSSSGYLHVDIAGNKDVYDNYSITIVTAQYYDQHIECPDIAEQITPLNHVRTRSFQVVLNQQNDYKAEAEANNDPMWIVNVELLLP